MIKQSVQVLKRLMARLRFDFTDDNWLWGAWM